MPGGDRFSVLLKTGACRPYRRAGRLAVLAATGRERLLQILGRKSNDLQLVTVILDDAGRIETTLVEPWTDYGAVVGDYGQRRGSFVSSD